MNSFLNDFVGSEKNRKNVQPGHSLACAFSEPARGFAVWQWGNEAEEVRGKYTFLFDDSDGVGTFMTIAADSNDIIREIELWRGDGKPIQRVPTVKEIREAVPGRIY